jgi:hypothetical protein
MKNMTVLLNYVSSRRLVVSQLLLVLDQTAQLRLCVWPSMVLVRVPMLY